MPHTREKAENHTRTCPRQEILLMPHPREKQGSEFVPYCTPENPSRGRESEGKSPSWAPALLGLPAVGWEKRRIARKAQKKNVKLWKKSLKEKKKSTKASSPLGHGLNTLPLTSGAFFPLSCPLSPALCPCSGSGPVAA